MQQCNGKKSPKSQGLVVMLSNWALWFFIFDHYNYAWYATAHLVDLWNIQREQQTVCELLSEKGNFHRE